jgi:hypothetical protein
MTRHLVCFVMLTALAGAEAATVRGRTVDATQGPLPRVLVRLIPVGVSFATFRSEADLDGRFEIRDVPPGKYTLRLGQDAFRERTLPEFELLPGESKNLGAIELELAGCDAPGVMCDFVTAREPARKPEPHPTVSRGYIILKHSWSADLDRSRVFEADGLDRRRQSRGQDVVLLQKTGSWWLVPANGAFLSQTDCVLPRFTEIPIRLDEMGPGAEICVQTDRHRRSHVFIVDEIRPESPAIRLWHVTWK